MVPNIEQLDRETPPTQAGGVDSSASAPGTELRLTEEQFHAVLEGFVGGWGQLSKMAKKWGVDPTDLSRVLRRIQGPGPKLLKALNVRIERVYVMTVETGEMSGTNS